MTSVRTDSTVDALRRIRVQLDGVRGRGLAPLSDAEIARARADLVQSVGAHLEDLEAVRGDLETLFVDAQPADYFATYGDRLASIAAPAVLKEARRINPDELFVVLVGDRTAMGDLAALGPPVQDVPPELVR
jgi:zinc protease